MVDYPHAEAPPTQAHVTWKDEAHTLVSSAITTRLIFPGTGKQNTTRLSTNHEDQVFSCSWKVQSLPTNLMLTCTSLNTLLRPCKHQRSCWSFHQKSRLGGPANARKEVALWHCLHASPTMSYPLTSYAPLHLKGCSTDVLPMQETLARLTGRSKCLQRPLNHLS